MSISKSERILAGLRPRHDDAVGQEHRLLDVVGDDEDALGGHLLAHPEFEKLGTKVFGGQDIERREGLVHEEHFGLDDESAGEAHALLHAAGEFLGVSGLKAIETDGVDHAEGALVAFDGTGAAGDEGSFHVFQHGEPGKQSETLEDDGDGRNLAGERLPVPEDFARRGLRESGENAQQG